MSCRRESKAVRSELASVDYSTDSGGDESEAVGPTSPCEQRFTAMLPGLLLLCTLLWAHTATARPASQTVFAADASFSPLDDSHHSPSFSPLLPPAIPLAVKSPCE